MADDNTSAPLTVAAATEAFLKRATPQEQGQQQDAAPVEGAEATDTTPSPEDRAADAEGSEEQAPEVTQPDASFTVLIDGKEQKVTAEEARNGYLRQQDYTRKTQGVSEAKKAADTEAQQYREQRSQYADGVAQLRKILEASTPPEPKEQLQGETPGDFALRKLAWSDHMRRVDAANAELQRVEREQAADFQKQQQERLVQEEQKLLEAVPEWRDPAKGRPALEGLRDYAKERGFTDQELSVIFGDHRSILLIRDAVRYRDLLAKKPDAQKRVEQVKTATPGSPKVPDPTAGQKRAMETLKKSGRVSDAAAAFAARGQRSK